MKGDGSRVEDRGARGLSSKSNPPRSARQHMSMPDQINLVGWHVEVPIVAMDRHQLKKLQRKEYMSSGVWGTHVVQGHGSTVVGVGVRGYEGTGVRKRRSAGGKGRYSYLGVPTNGLHKELSVREACT